MPVPVDPGSAAHGAVIGSAITNARLKALYDTFDPGIVGITDSNVAAAAAIAPSKIALAGLPALQQAWQTVPLVSGSTVFTPANLSYMKDSLGFVHFRGDIFVPTVAAWNAGAAVCTLPAGYRPGVTTRLSLATYQATDFSLPRHIDISTAGVVSLYTGGSISAAAGSAFSFGMCSFRAEN